MPRPALTMILVLVMAGAMAPTMAPAQPTAQPATEPVAQPTTEPAAQPATELPVQPTAELPVQPTAQPAVPPTAEPTAQPTAQTTVEPAAQTTVQTTTHAATGTVGPANAHDAFFAKLRALCGLSFEGKVTEGNASDAAFANQRLVMNVRACGENVIEIPFQVGEDRSRTWVLTRTGSGIQLKHLHRHKDGSDDVLTNYGGHTDAAGWPTAQSFPADPYSKDLFVARGIPQAAGNTWHLYIYPEQFTYHLTREGREFRLDFDLTRPVPAPPASWGKE